jgi:hypothetical protein
LLLGAKAHTLSSFEGQPTIERPTVRLLLTSILATQVNCISTPSFFAPVGKETLKGEYSESSRAWAIRGTANCRLYRGPHGIVLAGKWFEAGEGNEWSRYVAAMFASQNV